MSHECYCSVTLPHGDVGCSESVVVVFAGHTHLPSDVTHPVRSDVRFQFEQHVHFLLHLFLVALILLLLPLLHSVTEATPP